jgi:activator of Hsp90 ATPase-like protein
MAVHASTQTRGGRRVNQGAYHRDVAGIAEQAQVRGEAPAGERGADLVGPVRQPAQDRQQGEQFAVGGVAQRLQPGTRILEWDPPRRLVHTWRSLYDPVMAAEPESRVTWEIEPMADGVAKLTLVHDRLDASPRTAASVRGWSYILSNLKTVMETGQPLPQIM